MARAGRTASSRENFIVNMIVLYVLGWYATDV